MEKLSLVGKSKVLEVIDRHPEKRILLTVGLAYRNPLTRNAVVTREHLCRTLDWAAASDVTEKDDCILVECFSENDLY